MLRILLIPIFFLSCSIEHAFITLVLSPFYNMRFRKLFRCPFDKFKILHISPLSFQEGIQWASYIFGVDKDSSLIFWSNIVIICMNIPNIPLKHYLFYNTLWRVKILEILTFFRIAVYDSFHISSFPVLFFFCILPVYLGAPIGFYWNPFTYQKNIFSFLILLNCSLVFAFLRLLMQL